MDIEKISTAAGEYFEYHPNSSVWNGKSEKQQQSALKIAALDIENYLGGLKTDFTDPSLQNAVFEQALWIIIHENGYADNLAAESIDNIGSVSYRERSAAPGNADPSLLLSPRARTMADAYRRQCGITFYRG